MTQKRDDAPCSVDRFNRLVELWEDLDDEQRQELVNHWSVAFTMEDLKEIGLVAGESVIDLPVARMMFGFAVARGFTPSSDPTVIQDHAKMFAACP